MCVCVYVSVCVCLRKTVFKYSTPGLQDGHRNDSGPLVRATRNGCRNLLLRGLRKKKRKFEKEFEKVNEQEKETNLSALAGFSLPWV